MLTQFVSNLHLEFLYRRWPGERIVRPAPGADVLVLAGDLALGAATIQLFRDWPVSERCTHALAHAPGQPY